MAELSGRTVNYGYDTDYHLKSETITADPGGNNGAESYTYDFVGNRKTLSSTIPSLSGSISYSYDNNDRLTTDTYDTDGNTISSAGTASTYDFENRMLTHESVSMVYDGDGNRVSETAGGTTTKYLIDSLNPTGYAQVLDELVSGAVTKTYTYGLQRISENQLAGSTWTPSFYGYDGHGNVRFLTSTTGVLGNTYQFDSFGMPIASAGTTANTYLYSGERFDQNIGLYHLRARYYNQGTGRFETMDPDLGNIFDPGTLPKYAYAEANPVNYVDPNGTDPFDEEGTIDSSFYRFITRFKKWADPAARARICYAAALLQGLDPDATWAAYVSCILKNSAPFN
ncbi:MAG TPA: RHS repeat-associated core domain-containing protein [Candidatus Sulfotelmatobacter sp.]